MNIFKEIMGRIFALWALIVFVVTMLIVIPPMWIIGLVEEPKRTAMFRKISKIWMNVFFLATGCSIKIKGKEKFKNDENYIIICNHNSLMDVPVTTPFIPGANKTIAKIEFTRIPLFGLIYKRGSVLVDRKNKDSRVESFKKMKDVIAMGMHMCIYPEGTRNKTTEPLKSFHDGAFRLALDTKKPLLPAIIFNTKKALPAGKVFFFWPSKLEMHFLTPIEIKSSDTIESLKENSFSVMANYYLAHQKPS
jgi:1-acyl-sn-glycerol-3-phosphate acyltransferase